MKKLFIVLALVSLSCFVSAQNCIYLGCAANYGTQTTNASASSNPAPSNFSCYTGFSFRQITWQYFYSPSGGNFVQGYTSTTPSLDLDWIVFDAGTTMPSVTCPISTTGMTVVNCSTTGSGAQTAGPGHEGTVATTAGHYYLVGVTFWQADNVTWQIGAPTLGGAALNSTNCPSGSGGGNSSNATWQTTGNAGINPTNNFLGTTDNQPLVIKTNNVEAMRILGDRNVGIGTNNPQHRLDVSGTSRISDLLLVGSGTTYPSSTKLSVGTGVSMLHFSEGSGSATPTLSIFNTSSTAKGISVYAGTGGTGIGYDNTGFVGFSAEAKNNIINGTPGAGNFYYKLFGDGQSIFSTANLGSTAALSANVSILNSVAANKALVIRGATSQSGDLTQWQNSGGTVLAKVNSTGVFTVAGLALASGAGANKVLTSDASGNATWQNAAAGSGWGLTGNSSTSPSTNYIGTSDNQSVVFKANNAEAMRIINGGNIGIGVTSPSTKLDVNGTIKATGLLIAASAGAGKVLTSDGSGNATWQAAAISGWGLTGSSGTSSSTNYIGTSDNQSVVFKANNAEAMRIINGGNIGIGVTSPSSKLDVNGTIKATGLLIAASAGSGKVLTSDGSGNATWQIPVVTSAWSLSGNASIDPSTTYIGTTDGQPLIFKTSGSEAIRISATGQVTVGAVTAPSGVKLAVGGNIIAEKVTVKLISNWADFVFNDNYRLPTLEEIEKYITRHKHLPDMPSTAEVEANGVNLGDNQAILLRKIEELTLHMIEMNKKVEQLRIENEALKSTLLKK